VPLFDVAVQPCFLKKLNFLTTAGYLINLAWSDIHQRGKQDNNLYFLSLTLKICESQAKT
jgi:hypothetical protein